MHWSELNASDKVVLEVGTGRGGTTRELIAWLEQYPGSRLISVDLHDGSFSALKMLAEERGVAAEFRVVDAVELPGFAKSRIDLIVCNYTLCAIASSPGAEYLALHRFWEVLRPGGRLFVEEEHPIYREATEGAEEVFQRKWHLLRMAGHLLGTPEYREFDPATLAKVCRRVGFAGVSWEEGQQLVDWPECLEFFQYRWGKVLASVETKARPLLAELASDLTDMARQHGGMLTPHYLLWAEKRA